MSTARGGILGRRRSNLGTVSDPSISAVLDRPGSTETGSGSPKRAPATCPYPERPHPLQSGPAQDRWVRELVGSIVSRTAPVLLDRVLVLLALDLSPATFDRRIREGKLLLENVVVVGDRELYRREQVRALILAS